MADRFVDTSAIAKHDRAELGTVDAPYRLPWQHKPDVLRWNPRRNHIVTIHLPEDLERFVHEQVRAGRYPSEDDVVRDALEQLRGRIPLVRPGLGSIGAMHDAAGELDQAVAHAMRVREERPWRLSPGE